MYDVVGTVSFRFTVDPFPANIKIVGGSREG